MMPFKLLLFLEQFYKNNTAQFSYYEKDLEKLWTLE